ncbi:EAL domain-containing protein [Cryptosporangium arvum]|uniref:EAL domain-containing protein n=1 Tax=Cryptosporangium arvum TaxID=80871 RepID=UPI0004B37F0F|nr:EAL domain-containing protein [Cryptosporangium arvum]
MGESIQYRAVVDLFSGRVPAHELTAGRGVHPLRMVELAAGLPTPLHLPLHPDALLRDPGLPDALAERCAATRRAPDTVTVLLAERYCMTDVVSLRRRCAALRRHGFTIGVDDVGALHGSLSVLAAIHPQVVKVHHTLVGSVAEYPEASAVIEAIVVFARKIGATLTATGVESDATVTALRSLGVAYGQGAALGGVDVQWRDVVAVPPLLATDRPGVGADDRAGDAFEGQTIRELLRRAMVASVEASGDEIRDVFGLDEDLLTVVLLDESGHIAGVVPRGTFMLAASGPFGHALHARRGVLQHAVQPRLVAADTPVSEAIRLVTSRSRSRVYDDLVVADRDGRCVGIVRVADLLTASQRNQVDVAISLDPVTELPSGKVVEDTVRRRLRDPGGVAISWVEVDRQSVVEAEGFLAGNALIVEAAAVLRRVAASMGGGCWLGHFGAGAFVLLTDRTAVDRTIRSLLDVRPEDRYGRPVDLTVATLDCPPASAAADVNGLSLRLAELMRHAHQLGGTAWTAGSAAEPGIRVPYASRPVLTGTGPGQA